MSRSHITDKFYNRQTKNGTCMKRIANNIKPYTSMT